MAIPEGQPVGEDARCPFVAIERRPVDGVGSRLTLVTRSLAMAKPMPGAEVSVTP